MHGIRRIKKSQSNVIPFAFTPPSAALRLTTYAPTVSIAPAPPLGAEAMKFLQLLRPAGPWVLTAIDPDNGKITTTTVDTADQVMAFVRQHNGTRNLYYSVNPTRTRLDSKAAKTDIAAVEYGLGDFDPLPGESSEGAKARYLKQLKSFEPRATALVDSGNGIQGLWCIERIELAEPTKNAFGDLAFSPEDQAKIADVEARIKAIMLRLGSVAGTQNIDRILRLPGTINLPGVAKRAFGRVTCKAKLLWFDDTDAAYPLSAFPKAELALKDEAAGNVTAIDWTEVSRHAGWLKGASDLPADFNTKGKIIVAHTGTLKTLNDDLMAAHLLAKPYASWSEVAMALAAVFKLDGRYSTEQIVAALLCDLDCTQHIDRQTDKDRAAERCVQRSYDPPKDGIDRTLGWRERLKNGLPKPSLFNARLAIDELGVECLLDTFHNRMHFGFRGDRARHELQSFGDEVSDNGIIQLRQMISVQFGVDMSDRFVRDAVISIALEHCFNPVRDMLDKAQADWDGVERLDMMAVTYFNTANTPLNRATVRKMMIAAVRRARHPGCKFDNIVVLESEEGWNKSTAFRVLAGDENFSDVSILGHGGREVQEQLADVWIHECAELAGMRKAEIETVKSFASRQEDRARRAYGHFLESQKRHSIEVGSTNSDAYLLSQTGNRRFWPLRLLKRIDIEQLKRDRLQLWGEAATYEANGESVVLDQKLWSAATAEQEKRRVRDNWEDIVADMPTHVHEGMTAGRVEHLHLKPGVDDKYAEAYHKIIHDQSDRHVVSTIDVLTWVLNVPFKDQTTATTMRLGNVMRLAGWQRSSNGKVTIEGKQVRGYFRRKASKKKKAF